MDKKERLIKRQREILAKIYECNKPINGRDVPFIYVAPQEVVDKLWIEFDKVCAMLSELPK